MKHTHVLCFLYHMLLVVIKFEEKKQLIQKSIKVSDDNFYIKTVYQTRLR